MFAKLTMTTLAALTAAVIGASTAQAASSDAYGGAVHVSFADLNLSSGPGAAAALQRIREAATSVCGAAPNIVDMGRTAIHRECMQTAVERAVASLNSPRVTALYTGGARRTPELASR